MVILLLNHWEPQSRSFRTTEGLFQRETPLQNLARGRADEQTVTDLQPLNDVSVVFGSRQAGVSAGRVLGRKSPAQDALLHHIVGLDKQVVHLAVQVHWDGDSSALSW